MSLAGRRPVLVVLGAAISEAVGLFSPPIGTTKDGRGYRMCQGLDGTKQESSERFWDQGQRESNIFTKYAATGERELVDRL